MHNITLHLQCETWGHDAYKWHDTISGPAYYMVTHILLPVSEKIRLVVQQKMACWSSEECVVRSAALPVIVIVSITRAHIRDLQAVISTTI